MTSVRTSRRLPVLILIALAVMALAWLSAGPSIVRSNTADAAGTPKPNCGTGFRTISSYNRGHGVSTLRFRDRDRLACFTFTKTTNVGKATDIGVKMYRPLGNVTKVDRAKFEYYAGPIYVHMPADYDNPKCKLNTLYIKDGKWIQHGYYSCAAF